MRASMGKFAVCSVAMGAVVGLPTTSNRQSAMCSMAWAGHCICPKTSGRTATGRMNQLTDLLESRIRRGRIAPTFQLSCTTGAEVVQDPGWIDHLLR